MVTGYWARSPRPTTSEVPADDGSTTVVGFEQAIIACGSEPVTLPFIPHDDPRVIDSTGALELAQRPRAAAGRRGRDHRPGDGHRLLRAGHTDHRRRAARPAHPRRRQGPRQPAVQADLQAVRGHLPDHQGHPGRRRARRAEGPLRGGQGARDGHLRPGPGRGRPPPQRPRHRGRERRGGRRRARLHRRRQAAAHQRAPHLRHRRRRRPAHAGPQGGPRGPRRRRGRGRPAQLLRRPRHPLGGLHRPRGRLGRRHRDRGQGGRDRVRQGHLPVGWPAAAPCPLAATRA